MSDLVVLYALTVHVRLGPKRVAWEGTDDEISEIAGLDDDGRERLAHARALGDAIDDEVEYIAATGTSLISINEARYPSRLRRLNDPPPLLYVRGKLPDENDTAVAVVGSHQADAEGIREAVDWGQGLVERNATVISGLARGIDGGAHTGALAKAGRTVAVLGSGFDNIYPPEHRTLAEQISTQGALISEYAPRTPLTKRRLIRRNRLIVGLSDAVVVVRVHDGSNGSMESIARARDLAVPVFLVASDTSEVSQRAVADGAIAIQREPAFALVLSHL